VSLVRGWPPCDAQCQAVAQTATARAGGGGRDGEGGVPESSARGRTCFTSSGRRSRGRSWGISHTSASAEHEGAPEFRSLALCVEWGGGRVPRPARRQRASRARCALPAERGEVPIDFGWQLGRTAARAGGGKRTSRGSPTERWAAPLHHRRASDRTEAPLSTVGSQAGKRALADLRSSLTTPPLPSQPSSRDEMDVYLSPKNRRAWMVPGHRRFVATPAENKKHFVAGARRERASSPGRGTERIVCRLVCKRATEHPRARRNRFGVHRLREQEDYTTVCDFAIRQKPMEFRSHEPAARFWPCCSRQALRGLVPAIQSR